MLTPASNRIEVILWTAGETWDATVYFECATGRSAIAEKAPGIWPAVCVQIVCRVQVRILIGHGLRSGAELKLISSLIYTKQFTSFCQVLKEMHTKLVPLFASRCIFRLADHHLAFSTDFLLSGIKIPNYVSVQVVKFSGEFTKIKIRQVRYWSLTSLNITHMISDNHCRD